jgi:hypothetical protein
MAGRRYGNGGGATVVESTSVGRNVHWIPPLALFVIGGLAILWGFLCITIQLETTEANIAGLSAMDAFKPDLTVLMQPWDLVFSSLSFGERMAYILHWQTWGEAS